MEFAILVIGSVTYAQRARNLLKTRGITASLVRARASGCSYGVRLDKRERERALALLQEAGIKTEET